MDDALGSGQSPGAVLLDEIDQGDDQLQPKHCHQGQGGHALRLAPADQQKQGGVDQVADPVQPQLAPLRRPPGEAFGEFVVEQGVEGPHGDLKRDQDPQQVGHLRRP
ncbi:MAG: hypothetical protein ACK4VY_03660 [Brevundimonas sp.]